MPYFPAAELAGHQSLEILGGRRKGGKGIVPHLKTWYVLGRRVHSSVSDL